MQQRNGLTSHGGEENGGREEHVPLHAERFVREEELLYYFSADEQLERQRREHVQSEAEAGDVDESVVLQAYMVSII